MSSPTTKRGAPDLDHAESQAEKAKRALKVAMDSYGHRHRYEIPYLRLKRALTRTNEALEEIRKDKGAGRG